MFSAKSFIGIILINLPPSTILQPILDGILLIGKIGFSFSTLFRNKDFEASRILPDSVQIAHGLLVKHQLVRYFKLSFTLSNFARAVANDSHSSSGMVLSFVFGLFIVSNVLTTCFLIGS